jgi:Pentapeptide repeats (8 copies)
MADLRMPGNKRVAHPWYAQAEAIRDATSAPFLHPEQEARCGTDLRGADLRGAGLRGADLTEADLSRARVSDEQLAEAASYHGATTHDRSQHDDGTPADVGRL